MSNRPTKHVATNTKLDACCIHHSASVQVSSSDGQTDRQTELLYQYHASSVLTRDTNVFSQKLSNLELWSGKSYVVFSKIHYWTPKI